MADWIASSGLGLSALRIVFGSRSPIIPFSVRVVFLVMQRVVLGLQRRFGAVFSLCWWSWLMCGLVALWGCGGCGVGSFLFFLFFFFGGMVLRLVVLVFGFFSQGWSSLGLSVADWIVSSGLGLSALRICGWWIS